jgi:hypothetical protein
VYKVGDQVLLSTFHRCHEYMQRGDSRVTKFMCWCWYDGPYTVNQAWPATFVCTLKLPESMKIFPTFHASLLRLFRANKDFVFPLRAHFRPGPVITPDSEQ